MDFIYVPFSWLLMTLYSIVKNYGIAIKKENTELLNSIQHALDEISFEQRLQIMQDAVDRQPAIAE